MRHYAAMKIVGPLPTRLPTNDVRITTEPADLILYQGDKLLICNAQNTWSFTRLGRLDGVTAGRLKEAIGTDDAEVTLSLAADD
jgi:hypothetical protein